MDQKSPLTPPPTQPLQMNSPTPAGGSAKLTTPDRLSVPKAFKYPEMYKSPTDQMNSPTPAGGSAKLTTPDRLSVPKAFKYPEMYKSPTDQIMSPVSKGLLARTKSNKSSGLLPPSFTKNQQNKIQASKFQDLSALKT